MNSSLIFTKTNCAIALNLKPVQIKEILIDCDPVQVVALIDGNEHILVVNKYDALKALASTRKERSVNLKVEQDPKHGTQWKCKGYKIITYPKYIECECKDWQNLSDATKTEQVACKHVYAVLNKLGYGSLAKYVDAGKAEGAIANLHTTLTTTHKDPSVDYPACTDSYSLTTNEVSMSYGYGDDYE